MLMLSTSVTLREPSMNVHKNARMTVFGRERLVKQVLERVLTPAAAAAAAGIQDSARRYVGTVAQTFKISRPRDGLSALHRLGKVGELMNGALTASAETNRYIVRTPTGNLSVASDESYANGDCVVVVPEEGAIDDGAYDYGEARVERCGN